MSVNDLEKIIAETVVENIRLNSNSFGSDIVKESIPLQISVASTIQVLEKLGLIKLSNN